MAYPIFRKPIYIFCIGTSVISLLLLYRILRANHHEESLANVDVDVASIFRESIIKPLWPPLDRQDLYDAKSGRYALTLKPIVNKTVEWQEEVYDEAYKEIMNALFTRALPKETELEALIHKDGSLRIDPEVINLEIYPQSINLQSIVNAIRTGQPIKHAPEYNENLFVTHLPPNICEDYGNSRNSTYPLELVVIIKTCINCFSRRQTIRDTFANRHLWGDFNVSFIFVVGTLDSSTKSQYRPHEIGNSDQIVAMESLLKDEMKKYDDILTGSFEDSYYKLHNKLVFSFRWASAFCAKSTPLFLFMDDDVTIIPRTLVPLIRRIPQRSQRFLIAGLFNRTYDVRRHNSGSFRWALHSADYPYDRFIAYHWGFAYLVGAEMATNAAIAMAFIKPLRVDDIYLGIVWKKLHYPLLGLKEFTYDGIPTDGNETIAVGFTEKMMSKIDWTMTCSQQVAKKRKQVCARFRP